jgi:glycosyltransferase involved in cell wall biosynthesis
MKICMLAPDFLPTWSGVGTYIVELIKNLNQNNEVHVVTPIRKDYNGNDISSLNYNFSDYFRSNIHIHFVGVASDTFLYNARFQYECLKFVPKLIKKEKIDLIHSHSAHMPDLLLKLRKSQIPTLTTVHTTIKGQREGTKASETSFHNLEFSEKMTLLAYPFLFLADEFYFGLKTYYITPSEWMKKYLLADHPNLEKNVFVVPHGVNTNLFKPSDKERSGSRNIVLFVGRLVALKGILYLVRAIPFILRDHPNTLFVFIGPGDKNPYVETLGKWGVREENFLFLGQIDQVSLAKWFEKSDVYVLPSLSESFSLTLLEAMSCGLAAVVSNVGGPSEIIENNINGLLIKPGSVKAISEAVTFLLDNPDIRRNFGTNARETIEKTYTWQKTALKTSSIYKQVIDLNQRT